MTTTEDITIEPGKGWTRESSHIIIDQIAKTAPHHMTTEGGAQQLALLLQIVCKELQALANEVVELQNAAELQREASGNHGSH
jgi:hypothetical protein